MNKSSAGLPEGHNHYIGTIQYNDTPSESITLIMVTSQCKVLCAADGSYNLKFTRHKLMSPLGRDEGNCEVSVYPVAVSGSTGW